MLKLCLTLNKPQPIYPYKSYAYRKEYFSVCDDRLN